MCKREFNFTVLTCTLNRASLLPRAYRSLLDQSFTDFEWVVVDNGSEDDTQSVILNWQQEAPFPIQYLYEPRRGKAFALNTGIKLARGLMTVILDDDDWFLPWTLERLAFWWGRVPLRDKSGCLGVIALCAFKDGKIIGTPFPEERTDGDMIEMMYRKRVKGDKCGSDRTDLLRVNPFPEDLGSMIVEGITWNRLWSRYRKCCVNEILKIVEYHDSGLTITSKKAVWTMAKSMYIYNKELLELRRHLPIDIVLKHYANFIRCGLIIKIGLNRQWKEAPLKWLWLLTLPIGFVLYLHDFYSRRKLATSQHGVAAC